LEKEKLIIRNFGPIKNVELDLGRFNILIGEQATGKSTVAKVLAVCRYFSYIVSSNIESIVPELNQFTNGLNAWGLTEYVKANSYIFYNCKHYSLIVENEIVTSHKPFSQFGEDITEDIPVPTAKIQPISPEFANLLLELDKIKPKKTDDPYGFGEFMWVIPTSFFLNDVKNVMDNPFYMPTQRGLQSIFSLGQNSIQNLSDALFNQLAKMDGIVRRFTNETYIEPLDIFYKNVQGHGYVRKANETEYYSLFNAASGYQSEIPIVLVIKYYNELKKRNKTFLIEEPEQNLFPSAQERLIEYLVHQTVSFNNSVLLTTQSPYVLTSLNNMMYAYQVGQQRPEQADKVIDKKYWISADEVSAYRMMNDGTAKDIMDSELKQIDAGEVDEVSRIINTEWDKLANIEYGRENDN